MVGKFYGTWYADYVGRISMLRAQKIERNNRNDVTKPHKFMGERINRTYHATCIGGVVIGDDGNV
jgi:hypothetical protein